MNIITIDFETYYDQQFSLTKITTEEYIRDERFEAIGVCVKVDDEPTEWFSGTREQTKEWLDRFNMPENFVVAHNMMFDGAILAWHFDIRPKVLGDTLAMARAVDGTEVGNSLAKLALRYGLGVKGTEVLNALGKNRRSFAPDELDRYGDYCKNDVEITYQLFNILLANFKKKELKLIDLTLRMFTEPVLELNLPLLEQHLINVVTKKEQLIADASADREVLMSNEKFANRLREFGVDPPMKISLTTGKLALAMAKSDAGFKELADHPDERVQALVAARLGTKSTLEETRTQRFIDISKRGKLPVPLRYYAAHTGRWGGDDKLNLQNLPRKSPLKSSILAPEGYVLIDSDSSQIEARVLAWLSGQNDLVKAFEMGEDVYKWMASSIYGKTQDKITEEERFVGKTTILGCIGSGTMVLCELGWKPIEEITLADKLWDGKEWVCHEGLVSKGLKQTLNLCGVWLTPDHKVLSGTQWLEAQAMVSNENILCQALGTGAENLPSQDILQEKRRVSAPLLLSATADYLSTQLIGITSKTLRLLGATFVQRARQVVSGTGNTLTPCMTTPIESGYLIDYPPRLADAITQARHTIPTTGVEGLKSISRGEKTALYFSSMCKHLMDGMLKNLKWIASIITKGTNPIILGSCREATTCVTSEQSAPLRQNLQTYDLAYAGPRNRFTVLTERGPIIVHNCGYGMGAVKFQLQLKTFNMDANENFCKHVLKSYRSQFSHIPALWDEGHKSLEALSSEKLVTTTFGIQPQAVSILPGIGYDLPSGLPLKYMDLRATEVDERGRPQYIYSTRKGPVRIYGGKVVENLCQALARCIVGEQMLRIAKRYKVVLTVHDAVACIVPIEEKEVAAAYVQECMRWRPEWASTLPLNCEVKYGDSYGTTTKFKG